MASKIIKILIALIVLLAIGAGGYYWYYFIQNPTVNETGEIVDPFTFLPFNRNTAPVRQPIQTPIDTGSSTSTISNNEPFKMPKLRQLSIVPVSGLSASSTASSSLVRFMDRGTGHVYEADNISTSILKLSNTTLPKIYETYWNKNLNAFVLRYLRDESDVITNFYGGLRSTGTSTAETPFEIKGKYLSPDISQIAVSPIGNKIFSLNTEGGRGVGYTSAFDETGKVKVADLPLSQVIAEWPEINTVSLTTKATASAPGYFYSLDIRNGTTKKIIGGIRGLTGKLNGDLSHLIYSSGGTNNIRTYYFSTKDSISKEIIFKTISDKCIWSTLRKNEVYCAVPTEIPDAIYPDDWYKGKVSFIDQIWHLDTTTGEVHLLANLLDLSNKLLDATDLTLDPKENFLYFINKRDLTLWSLDLNQ